MEKSTANTIIDQVLEVKRIADPSVRIDEARELIDRYRWAVSSLEDIRITAAIEIADRLCPELAENRRRSEAMVAAWSSAATLHHQDAGDAA